MIVYDRHVMRPVFLPNEADAPLIVDANAMLALAIALQRLEPIPWRCTQITQSHCGVDHVELAHNNSHKCPPSRRAFAMSEQFLGLAIIEALNHETIRNTYCV
jgi:hypothetical protein